jgi:hypothetical protein
MFLARVARLPILALAILLTISTTATHALEVGWAKVEINPPFPTPLGGYFARWGAAARGVHDPTYARALVMRAGSEKIALVSLDVVLITRALRDAVENRVSSLGLSSLLLCATHNHSGVGGYWDNLLAEIGGMGRYDQRIFDFLVDRIVTAVTKADQTRIPARFGSTTTTVSGLNKNRRRDSDPVDSELSVIRVDDLAGRPRAAIVNFAAHPTLLGHENLLLSGDYPGVLTRAMERDLSIALFSAGAGGDLTPIRPAGRDAYDTTQSFGLALSARATKILTATQTSSDVSIKSRVVEVSLPKANLKGTLGAPMAYILAPLFRFFAPTKTLLQAIRINDLAIHAWPGEVVAGLGLDLKQRARQESGYRQVLVVSLANDHLGYIQTQAGYDRADLETRLSFYGPYLGEQLIADAQRLLQEIR